MRLIGLISTVILVVGCTNPNGIWESQRLQAASIQDPVDRANALAIAAEAAASVGDLQTVKASLADLPNDPQYDEIVDRCAIQLGNAGYIFAAREVANMVRDGSKRKATLAKVGP